MGSRLNVAINRCRIECVSVRNCCNCKRCVLNVALVSLVVARNAYLPTPTLTLTQFKKDRQNRAIFFGTRFGNLAAAANALCCTRLPARQLILGSEWTCYNRDFDINELLPFAHLSSSNLHRLLKGGPQF